MDMYRCERDREKFLEYVGEAVKRYGIKVHTYYLMTTHFYVELHIGIGWTVASTQNNLLGLGDDINKAFNKL